MSRFKSAYELVLDAMVMLADSSGSVWSQENVEKWLMDAIRDYSAHFSRDLTALADCVADQQEYALPDMFKTILRVEYPVGQDPPEYLQRLSYINPKFHLDTCYYDIIDSAADSNASLVISDKPDSGDQIEISYTADHYSEVINNIEDLSRANPCQLTWTDHNRINGEIVDVRGITQEHWSAINNQYTITIVSTNIIKLDGLDTSAFAAAYVPTTDPGKAYAQLSVPPTHYEILLTFIQHAAQRERLMSTNQSPESSTLLLSQLSSNADKVWRRYERLLSEAKKRLSSAGPTHIKWSIPDTDRIY